MKGCARRAILSAAQAMHREGLVVGAAGNVSARAAEPEAFYITPTRVPYAEMRPDDIVKITYEGDPIEGERVPSVESLVHAAVYRARPDAGALVHAHPVFASVLAVRHERIPPMLDEQVVYIGGGVELSPYASSGSEELAANAVDALGPRNAVLLANHGTLAVGDDPEHALEVTRLVERLAQIWYLASARPGAHGLPGDIVAAEVELFRMMQAARNQ